jgi:hypothetical protein
MDNFCDRCFECCKIIPVDFNRQAFLRNGLQPIDEDFMSMLSALSTEEAQNINENYVTMVQNIFPEAEFFKCSYLNEENICTNEDRQEFCKSFPSHPLAIIPDECEYYGELFIKSEELKQKVRKYKEEIIYYEAMIASGCKDEKNYQKIIHSLQRFIDKYIPFGSEEW